MIFDDPGTSTSGWTDDHHKKSQKLTTFGARGVLRGLELDEIDAAISFLMLPMPRDGLKWPLKASQSH